MNAKPGDLFVGIINFFGVILPGAILAYAYSDWGRDHLIGELLTPVYGDGKRLTLFFFAAYLLGHFIFPVGSKLDGLYDWVRRRFYSNDNPTLECALAIKDKYILEPPGYRINRQVLKKLKAERITNGKLKALKKMKTAAP